MRILVVDDDYVSRVKLAQLLAPRGHCDCSPNGELALKLFEQAYDEMAPYDLVTMDINMPGLSGREVLTGMRAKEKEWGLPSEFAAKIIMVTGKDSPKDVLSSYLDGCDGYLAKPIDPEGLEKVLREAGCKP